MDFIITYGTMLLDILIIVTLFYVLLKNLPLNKLRGAVKGMLYVAVIWFVVARILNMPMASALLGTLTQYGFLLIVILYREEFKQAIEVIGRKRVLSTNTETLISTPSRKELAKAVMTMARKKHGGVIVIARESTLDDVILNGTETGDTYISQNFIQMNFHPESMQKGGALIIKDDMILSVDSRLPLARARELESTGAGRRHFAGLGVVTEYDCMSIVVSGSTGTISMFGKIDGKTQVDYARRVVDVDIHEGIDEMYVVSKIEEYLKGGTSKQQNKTKSTGKKNKKAPKKQKGKKISGRDRERIAKESRRAQQKRIAPPQSRGE